MPDSIAPSRNLSPKDKASILLLSLGKDAAAKVMKHLNPREIQIVGTSISEVDTVSRDTIGYVMEQFLQELGEDALGIDPSEFAQSLLADALGEGGGGGMLEASMLADKVKGIEALKWMHPSTISNMLRNEHPQVVAIILSYFDSEQAAEVLRGIPERFQAEIVYRISTLSTIQPRALFDLNDVLERASGGGDGGKLAMIGGVKQAAEILNLVGGGIDSRILDDIAVEHQDLSREIQDKMFVFDDIGAIDDRGIQTIIAEVPGDLMTLALKGADDKIKEKFLGNMSKRQADILRDDLETGGPVKLSAVEDAQRAIIQTVRRLADEEKIMMPGGGEEFV